MMSSKEALKKTLPKHAPELTEYDEFNWDDSSFALYSTIGLSVEELHPIASQLEKEWVDQSLAPPHLIRIPPQHEVGSGSLKNVVDAHIKLDKEIEWRDDGAAVGDLHWYPTAFVVITSRDWKREGALFAYVLEEDEDPDRKMDCFFFKPEDAFMMLSSIHFGDESFDNSKDIYNID